MASKENHTEQWQRCLEIIKCNVKEQEYVTWFQPIQFVLFNTETRELLLAVPSNYFFEMLDGQFKRLIYNVVWRVFSKDTRILYRIQTDSTNDITVVVEGSGTGEKMRKGKNDILHPARKAPTDDLNSQLNTEYRFENFIEGDSNKLPRAVGQSIADNPKQTTFNPLFIYGSSGVGKTHLVNAIGTAIKEKFPDRRVLYVAAHQFMVQFMASRRDNNINDFIQFYQTIDVLIIDDVDELAGKEKTQDAFFHIFNHLKMNGKQIILTCDREPSSMQGMMERLLTRFKWGLTCELEKPSQDLCRRILESKIRHDGLFIPEDVVDYISANVNENVRDMEGILNSLMAYSAVYNRDIDLSMAEQIVRRSIRFQTRAITLEDIIDKCCQHWNITQDDLFSKSRKAPVVLVRQTAMYLAQRHTKLTSIRIGQLIGGRNHATVLHAIQQICDRISTDKNFAQQVAEVEANLKQKK